MGQAWPPIVFPVARSRSLLHSITSSARASSVGGTSRPSALAALRLITSSYLVGACTGRSAGFTLEDANNILGRALILVDVIRLIGNQAASGNEEALEVHSRKLVACRKHDDQ